MFLDTGYLMLAKNLFEVEQVLFGTLNIKRADPEFIGDPLPLQSFRPGCAWSGLVLAVA